MITASKDFVGEVKGKESCIIKTLTGTDDLNDVSMPNSDLRDTSYHQAPALVLSLLVSG